MTLAQWYVGVRPLYVCDQMQSKAMQALLTICFNKEKEFKKFDPCSQEKDESMTRPRRLHHETGNEDFDYFSSGP